MKDHYQDMLTVGRFLEKGYEAVPLDQGRWSLLFAPDAGKFEESGWKFHFSVHRDDLARAWNMIVEELVNDKAVPQHQAKVARPDTADRLARPDHHNRGKMMVIYAEATVPPEHYQQLLERIERKLRTARVRPGVEVEGDNKVPGSSYMFYRNDKTLSGKYNRAAVNKNITMARQYNPDRKEDPYQGFSISEAAPAISLQQAAFWWWQDGRGNDGTPFTRVQVSDEANGRAVIKTLEDLGMKAALVNSKSLGLTVRVYGDDMERIQKTCTVANLQWQEAVAGDEPITRTPVANSAQAQDIIKTLEYLGIKGFEVRSKQFGLTVRVTGDDMKWVQEAQRELRLTRMFPPPQPPAMPSTLLLPQQPPPSRPPKKPRGRGILHRH